MSRFLYWIVELIARIHGYLLKLNDAYEYNFSDKELHFLIIGALGMRHDHIMVISWIYVFTLIIVITFAIEIGQRVTNTGVMEFADIVFGVFGFFCMFIVFSVIRGGYHLILGLIRRRRGETE